MSSEPHASQHKIWSHFQNAAPESFAGARPRLDYLLRRIAKLAGGARPAVLNIGIGDGYFEQQAAQRGWQVFSVDPDEQAVARLAGAGVAAHVGLIERLPLPGGAVDFVVAAEVLEQQTDPQRRPLRNLAAEQRNI
jgi:SAM-dependent methyltransferase